MVVPASPGTTILTVLKKLVRKIRKDEISNWKMLEDV